MPAEVVTLTVLPSAVVTYSVFPARYATLPAVAPAPPPNPPREAAGGSAPARAGGAPAQRREARGEARRRAGGGGARGGLALLDEHAADESAGDQQHAEQRERDRAEQAPARPAGQLGGLLQPFVLLLDRLIRGCLLRLNGGVLSGGVLDGRLVGDMTGSSSGMAGSSWGEDGSLKAQRFDRSEGGGASGGVGAEEQAGEQRCAEGEEDRVGGDFRLHAGDLELAADDADEPRR